MAIRIPAHEKFRPLYSLPPDIDLVICIGGRGGKKTYEISRFAAVDATIKERRVAVVRDEKERIRETILNEIFARYDNANVNGAFDGVFEKTQVGLRNLETGELSIFTQGFRASSNVKTANLKGISNVDTAIIEEAEDIRDPKKFNTFVDSIRTQRRLIIIMLNTPDIQHWIVKRYFNLEPVIYKHPVTGLQVDGYYNLVPKKLPGFLCIQTNYTDNKFLPENVVRSYEAYGDPNSPNFDLHYYLTAILGYASSGRTGQILRNVKQISLHEYMQLPYKEYYGLDFGTASPAGIVGVKMHRNKCFCRQLNYLPMETLQLGLFFAERRFTENDLIIADSADPLSIGKLRRGWNYDATGGDELTPVLREKYPAGIKGLNIRGCIKGPGSVEFGLGLLNGMELYAVTESEDLWNEIYNYIYEQDKSGNLTNQPKDEFNHLVDPWRYVAQSKGRFF